MYIILNNELYHHGIKGQHWGVRRFQNTDGSLKPAGEKRYGSGGKSSKQEQRQHKIDTYNQDKKNREALNQEMDKLINSNKRLKRDFGSSKNVDDYDAFDLALQDYGIKADSFYKARKELYSYRKENSKTIKEGQKLSKKAEKRKNVLNTKIGGKDENKKSLKQQIDDLDPKVKKALAAATAVTLATVLLSKNAHKNDAKQRIKRTEKRAKFAERSLNRFQL